MQSLSVVTTGGYILSVSEIITEYENVYIYTFNLCYTMILIAILNQSKSVKGEVVKDE